MKKITTTACAIAGIAIATAAGLAAAASAGDTTTRVAFPKDYASFANYLSLDRTGNPDQIIRLFANDVAARGRAEDGKLADGSILVGEIYKAEVDADGKPVTSALGRRIRNKLAAVAVMEKRAGWGADLPEEVRNGDWDFAIFSPDGKRLDKDINACRTCHAPLTAEDHVFSIEHLK